jgi:hypothetical protein
MPSVITLFVVFVLRVVMLSVVLLGVVMLFVIYVEWHLAQYRLYRVSQLS